MFGPEVRRRHYMTLFRQSGLNVELQSHLMVGGMQYCTYGDAAYMLRPWLQIAFVPQSTSAEQLLYNKGISAVREAVE